MFYFSALKKGDVLLPILSKNFLFSRPCESELTYAIDKNKTVIPISFDPRCSDILERPEMYSSQDEDIELRAPKIEAILMRANRIPANGRFDADFEANAQQLLQCILQEFEKIDNRWFHGQPASLSRTVSNSTVDPDSYETRSQLMRQMVQNLETAVNEAADAQPLDLRRAQDYAILSILRRFNRQLYNNDELDPESLDYAIKVSGTHSLVTAFNDSRC